MANVTVKIDDELLAKARLLAARRKTSINALVKQRLEEFVATDLKREATLKGLDRFYARSLAKLGQKTWSRNDLHER